jgi:hypothetical protein
MNKYTIWNKIIRNRYLINGFLIVLLSVTCLFSPTLRAQTLGDIRACFDLDIQDTIIWIEQYLDEEGEWKKDSIGAYGEFVYFVFKKENKIEFERWILFNKYSSLDVEDISSTRNFPDSILKDYLINLRPIHLDEKGKITDSMIENFNLFRDRITVLSENNLISNVWERFLRITIPAATAALMKIYSTSSFPQSGALIIPYYSKPLLNTLTILVYMNCLNQDDLQECIDYSFVRNKRDLSPENPVAIEYASIYANPIYQKIFYNEILNNIPKYILQYPVFNDFTNAFYFSLNSRKRTSYFFDFQHTIINSFEDH